MPPAISIAGLILKNRYGQGKSAAGAGPGHRGRTDLRIVRTQRFREINPDQDPGWCGQTHGRKGYRFWEVHAAGSPIGPEPFGLHASESGPLR